MSDPTREARLNTAFVTLSDSLVADYDLVELMHCLVDVSVDVLDAAAAGLVLANDKGELEIFASSSRHAEELEILQIRTRRGPCYECFVTGQPGSIPDLDQQAERWPQFAPAALEHGFRSMHAIPMRLRSTTIGALNLFRSAPGELAAPDRDAAQALADIATIGILQYRASQENAELTRSLQGALNSRVVIEQAKGVLAENADLTMDDAFVALRRYARSHRQSLTALAQAVVERRETPANILGLSRTS
jgi:transcriptional regulator with GAF, ATPase, and Fis domain